MIEPAVRLGQPPSSQPPSPRTGVAAVDDALAEVATSFERPVEEQVAAVERAHQRLREALDATG